MISPASPNLISSVSPSVSAANSSTSASTSSGTTSSISSNRTEALATILCLASVNFSLYSAAIAFSAISIACRIESFLDAKAVLPARDKDSSFIETKSSPICSINRSSILGSPSRISTNSTSSKANPYNPSSRSATLIPLSFKCRAINIFV